MVAARKQSNADKVQFQAPPQAMYTCTHVHAFAVVASSVQEQSICNKYTSVFIIIQTGLLQFNSSTFLEPCNVCNCVFVLQKRTANAVVASSVQEQSICNKYTSVFIIIQTGLLQFNSSTFLEPCNVCNCVFVLQKRTTLAAYVFG